MRYRYGILFALFISQPTLANTDFRVQKIERAIQSHDSMKPSQWDNLVAFTKTLPDTVSKLKFAHILFNQIPYLDGTNGQYMSPMEAIKRGGIVCKDYAMSKYLLLKEAGVSPQQMAITVHDSIGHKGGAHVVLEVKDQGTTYVSNQWLAPTQRTYLQQIGMTKNQFMSEVKKVGLPVLVANLAVAEKLDGVEAKANYRFKTKKVIQQVNENGEVRL